MKYAACIAFLCLLLGFACQVDPELKPELPAGNIQQVVPAGWPQPVYTFQGNPLSTNGFKLGRALFYETQLSIDNTVSCGSCHQNFAAFSHSGHTLSHGINGLLGVRNAPGLFNLNWNPYFMWDGGINHIEVQPLAPITNPVEMGEQMPNVLSKIQNSAKYRQLFKDAFGSDTVTTQRMFQALAQFMGMLYSYNSKYDLHLRGEQGGAFTASEQSGYTLFKQKCASCHTEPMLTDYSFRNNGLSPDPVLKDSGRAHITGQPQDMYTFRVPSLRNIAHTAPYMHDGRMSTLVEVLNHYNSGIVSSPTLDPLLNAGIPLTAQEQNDLIAFLNTLSDYAFLYDQRFADPN